LALHFVLFTVMFCSVMYQSVST